MINRKIVPLIVLICISLQACSIHNHTKAHNSLATDKLFDNIPDEAEIEILTYDGSNQVVHPDIILNNNTFYLAITPYPFFKDKFENPCLYSSKDGVNYQPNASNPITPTPSYDHNCDPDIFFDDDMKKCIYYVEMMRPDSNNIVLLEENDKCEYDKETILHYDLKNGDPLTLSPAIIKNKNKHYLFFVNYYKDKGMFIEYLKTKKLHCWNKEKSKNINIDFPLNYSPWHLDIFKGNNTYYMLINGFYGDDSDDNYSVFLATSKNLKDWVVKSEVLSKSTAKGKSIKYYYRSTGLINNNVLVIWYSYVTTHNKWKLAVKKINI
jgi:hypothetical protein